MENVAILGASNKSDRYSFMALELLQQYNHSVYPVHPLLEEINGVKVYKDLDSITDKIDTLTVYVSPKHLVNSIDSIIKLNPKRVIFNPGTESDEIISRIEGEGIKVLRACTLVMLKTNQY
ncbi:MAG: CoA-binding protein [Spirochaetales bacterium]|nr:CoA-binding protein [Spirochaetales bacterium]